MSFAFDLAPAAWLDAATAFRITFADLFIAASIVAVVAYRFGWRSALLGMLGGTSLALLAMALLGSGAAPRSQEWLSATLLLGFGLYLLYQFIAGLSLRDDGATLPAGDDVGWYRAPNLAGLAMAGWAAMAQSFEIAALWLNAAGHTGAATAAMGLGLGAMMLAALACACGNSGLFRRIPAYILDGVASVIITAYGACFLTAAMT